MSVLGFPIDPPPASPPARLVARVRQAGAQSVEALRHATGSAGSHVGSTAESARARLVDAVGAAGAEVSHLLDAMLDSVFTETFDVPDRRAALRLLSAPSPPGQPALVKLMEGQAVARLARRLTRSGATRVTAKAAATGVGGPAASVGATAVATVAVSSVGRLVTTIRRGSADLHVLASLLTASARRAGVELDPHTLRAVAVAAYVDPRRRPDLDLGPGKVASMLVAAWTREAASRMSSAQREERAEQRITAIERLDVKRLATSVPRG